MAEILRYEIGRKLKDTLMGEARHGRAWFAPSFAGHNHGHGAGLTASTSVGGGEAHMIDVLIKSFNKQCIATRTTLAGQSVDENPHTELTLHATLSSAATFAKPDYLCSSDWLVRMAHLNCNYICKLYDVRPSPDLLSIYAIMEFCGGGELFSLLHSAGSSFTLLHAKQYFLQLLLGLSAIHTLGIVHRDLSLENLLLTSDTHTLKIIDFGLAKAIAPGSKINEGKAVGKIRYMAPEIFSCIEYDPYRSDVWSCGVILWVMVMKVFPFNLPHASDPLFVMICSGRINDVMRGWGMKPMDEALCELFAKIFCPEEKRWTISDILQSNFLVDVWNSAKMRQSQSAPLRSTSSLSSSSSLSLAESPSSSASYYSLDESKNAFLTRSLSPSDALPSSFHSSAYLTYHSHRSLTLELEEQLVTRSIPTSDYSDTKSHSITHSVTSNVADGVDHCPRPTPLAAAAIDAASAAALLYPSPEQALRITACSGTLPQGPSLAHSSSRLAQPTISNGD